MGNCCYSPNRPKKKIVLLLLGLDNAGKTVAAKGLAGEPKDSVVPTIGFSVVNLKYRKFNVSIYDLGGGAQIRGIWSRYYVDAHGIIFVIDSSDYSRLNEARQVLEDLLTNEKVSGKPVLILANKQDRKGALDELDIVERLNIETLVNQQRCPTLVESCSATEENKRIKIDPGLEKGYTWLLSYISRDYWKLNARVERDVKEQNEKDHQTRQEIMERMNRDRRSTVNAIEWDTESVDMAGGDPFRPISELISSHENILQRSNRNNSSRSNNVDTSPRIYNEHKDNIVENNRPQSATQSIKEQLTERNNRRLFIFTRKCNRTAPATFLGISSLKNVLKQDRENVDPGSRRFKSADSAVILNARDLPNASNNKLSNGESISLNSLPSTTKRLPPLKSKFTLESNPFKIQVPNHYNKDVDIN